MKGHQLLIEHLTKLLTLAQNKEFHDFENTTFPAPKNALVEHLNKIKSNAINGEYDN